jgi:hypothetical protein
MLQQRKNVLGNATIPGGTAAAEGKCPGNHPKTGRNHSRRGSTDATKNAIPIKGRRFLFERQW